MKKIYLIFFALHSFSMIYPMSTEELAILDQEIAEWLQENIVNPTQEKDSIPRKKRKKSEEYDITEDSPKELLIIPLHLTDPCLKINHKEVQGIIKFAIDCPLCDISCITTQRHNAIRNIRTHILGVHCKEYLASLQEKKRNCCNKVLQKNILSHMVLHVKFNQVS